MRRCLKDGIRKIFSKNEDAFYINNRGKKSFEEYINIMVIH